MRFRFAKIALLLLSPVLFSASALLSSVPVANASRNARPDAPYVILVRHGEAPGRGEPENFDLNDCMTQRNLSDHGREQARQLREAFRSRGIGVNKVIASRWCRAQESARLLEFGSPENSHAFDNLDFNRNRRVDLIQRERDLIASWHGPGALLVVTHSSNIQALTGLTVEQGTMVVTNVIGEGHHTILKFGKVEVVP
jgi:phosphohistidine phosphatase SixA